MTRYRNDTVSKGLKIVMFQLKGFVDALHDKVLTPAVTILLRTCVAIHSDWQKS